MSEKNGDKARFNRQRKAKINRRIQMRAMLKALQEKAPKVKSAQAVEPASN